MTADELSERLMSFAARIGKAVDALPDTRMGRHIAGQLVRCGAALRQHPTMKKPAPLKAGMTSFTSSASV